MTQLGKKRMSLMGIVVLVVVSLASLASALLGVAWHTKASADLQDYASKDYAYVVSDDMVIRDMVICNQLSGPLPIILLLGGFGLMAAGFDFVSLTAPRW